MDRQAYFEAYRNSLTQIMNLVVQLGYGYKSQWDALDLGNVFTDADLEPYGVTVADFVAAVASIQTFMDLLSNGHTTNLYKITTSKR